MEASGDVSLNDEADLDKLMVLGNPRSSASIQEKYRSLELYAMQCEVRFGYPQTNIKHAGGNVFENLGAMLKLKLILCGSRACEVAPGAVGMDEVTLRKPSMCFSRIKEKEHSRKRLGRKPKFQSTIK